MKTILTHDLRVRDLSGISDFFCRLLGMQVFEEDTKTLRVGYHPESCHIVFRKTNVSAYCTQPNDFYWKIGITLPDLDASVAFLRESGVEVSDPVQFRDIGYMSKITDPSGFVIELLQHGFEGNAKPTVSGNPVGEMAALAHITLRVTDIAEAKDFFGDRLGMRLMSVQPVSDYWFCLYFYTWSDEDLPETELESVKNREWLWARPYTFIELQHLQARDATIGKSSPDASGFDGFTYGNLQTGALCTISVNDLDQLS